jgi:hypothetical protein
MRRRLCLFWALALLARPIEPQQSAEDPEVAKGVRQVEEGELEAGIFTLDVAARRLGGQPAARHELSRAYLYLGIAYVGKAQEALARARFRDALQQQGALSLSPDQFPPKVIALFEAARQELAQSAAATPAQPVPNDPVAAPKKGGSKTPLILLGVGGAAAAGVAVAAGGGGAGQTATPQTGDSRRTLTFGPELLPLGTRSREFEVPSTGAGFLEAKLTWREAAAVLIVSLWDANPPQTLASTGPSNPGQTEVTVTGPVTAAKVYKLTINHNTTAGRFLSQSDGTFTLLVKIP